MGTKQMGEVEKTSPKEAIIWKWIGVIQRHPGLYSGEISDKSVIPYWVVAELIERGILK